MTVGPRVLHVDAAREWRGGQQQLAYLLEARADDGWAGCPDGELARRIGPPTVALRPGSDPRNLWTLRAAALDYDVVAAHTPHAHMATLLLAGGARGPAVAVHRRVDFPLRHPWRYRRADAVIAVSHGVADVLARGGVRDNVHVVHDGVRVPPDTGPTPAADAPRPWWGACGALVAHKGHVHLVDALAELPGTLWIAGEGPLRPALLRRAEERGVSARVRLVGRVEPLGAWLRALDVFVHPSVEEGFGQVLVEALGAGCRVVATRVGGAPEAVGDAGRLVPPARPDLMAAAMRDVLTIAPRPEAARERASRYSVERMVEGTSAVYRALSASRAR